MRFPELCENLLGELEIEYSNRISELVQYENFMATHCQDETFNEIYRKMLIIMLYSYFEGFCKQSLLIYIDYLNRTNELVSRIKNGLAAVTIEKYFVNLAKTNYKPVDLGERALKEDGLLQMYGRRREFFSEYVNIIGQTLCIPDAVVDTESNLRASVLKKLLYKLEIDFTIVDDFQTDINEVVNKRNALAHGDRIRGVTASEYTRYRDRVVNLMGILKLTVYENFYHKKYLKEQSEEELVEQALVE